ncbi:hypothetical protein ACOBQJ_03420 [Pelotomaculum propionicicum]|uniref:hypothetical protein n=1 Tax=Pelotomaculum propionicicum TaxID=258475 RepID=UPI003B76F04D
MMSKLYNAPVQVELNSQQRPVRLRWYNKWYAITCCTPREEDQHWWSKLRNPEPLRYRCECEEGMICDLYFSDPPGVWILERIFD